MMKVEMGMGLKVAPMKLFTGSSNPALALEIAKHVGQPLGLLESGHFSDGESFVNISLALCCIQIKSVNRITVKECHSFIFNFLGS